MRFEEARRFETCATGPDYLGAWTARLARSIDFSRNSFAALDGTLEVSGAGGDVLPRQPHRPCGRRRTSQNAVTWPGRYTA